VVGRRFGVIAAPVLFFGIGLAYNSALSGQAGLSPIASKVLPAFAPYFALGMLAAVVAHGRTLSARWMWGLLTVGSLLVLADAWWAADNATRGSHAQSLRIWRDTGAATGFALVLLAVGAAHTAPRLLMSRPMAWVGERSYGIYLWHVPLLLVLRTHGLLPLSTVAGMAVVLPLTLAVAAASWRWIERPAQDWSRRVAARGSARRAAAALAGR
jgi:peptidoglycan/LPS O-acetylase OafA/YrhL